MAIESPKKGGADSTSDRKPCEISRAIINSGNF
jgi:hypothetical protein